MEMLLFTELVKFLRDHKYHVVVNECKSISGKYKVAMVLGDNIKAAFCTPSLEVYRYINNRIAADHVNCFDKWSKCPLIMELPVDGEELLKHLKFLGSDEGFRISETYEYLNSNPWPCDVKEDRI